ncbi:hypothetical protein [Sulfitobacter sp. PS-8MA]|uniref:hypothetical protein n=1 Tax=Sulfitobacter sp. PS-8MA TaxID=3237707 RepID=UPI0034C5CA35
MPETQAERMNRVLRDHEGYDGNGGTGELPVGDRSTARKPISKRDLREVFVPLAAAADELGDAVKQASDSADAAAAAASIAAEAAASETRAIILSAIVGSIVVSSDRVNNWNGTAVTVAGVITRVFLNGRLSDLAGFTITNGGKTIEPTFSTAGITEIVIDYIAE